MNTFRVCCGCGFTGRYSSRAKADFALRRHSCARWYEKAERAARGRARMESIDRTPTPCRHKFANHQHGTRACYTLDGCRCLPCSRAIVAAERDRRRQQAYGRYDRYVDAGQARAHVLWLMGQGMGLKRIVAVSGVSQGGLWKLVYGKRADSGVQRPSRRILRSTHDKIMTTRVDLAGGQPDPAGSGFARLQLRALVAIGWPQSRLAARLGKNPANFGTIIHGRHAAMHADTVRAIANLYAELSMQPPSGGSRGERAAAVRAKRYAAARGWLTPIDLELRNTGDDAREDAGGGWVGYLDEQAIWRRLHGDKTVRLTRDEQVECLHRWTASGRPFAEFERTTGMSASRLRKFDAGIDMVPCPDCGRELVFSNLAKHRRSLHNRAVAA